MKTRYAMMVDLSGQRVLVVGGGEVAERKIASLLEAEAKVKVVSPTATKAIARDRSPGTPKTSANV